MDYKIENSGNVFVLRLLKDISIYQLGRFKEAIEEIKKKEATGGKRVVIDLKEVGFIDALALGVLTTFSKEMRDAGGEVKLASMNEDIRLVFDLSHLSKVYEIHATSEEAVKSFS